jgi:hypothetical protein
MLTLHSPPVWTKPCRFSLLGASEREKLAADQITAPVDGLVIFAAGVVIDAKWRLTVSGITATEAGPVGWSQTFTVVAVSPPRSHATQVKVWVAGVPSETV